jgi:CheY-like chemotaxis protein
MKTGRKAIEILVADDDPEDRMLIIDALKESRLTNNIQYVENGEELLDFLRNEGKYTDAKKYPTPGIILLDLNMPKKDGREALKELRADPRFRSLPVVVLTTSQAEEDIFRTYDLGANSFITKPVSFSSLVSTMKALNNYWFEIVELPHHMDEA